MQGITALRSCPFCGGGAELRVRENLFGAKTARVSCMCCRSASDYFTEGKTVAFLGIPSRYVTIDGCISNAVKQWNRRAEEDKYAGRKENANENK